MATVYIELRSSSDAIDFVEFRRFKTNVIDPLIAEGLVAMTHQDTPNSPNQKYYLTGLGTAVLDNDSLKQAAGVSEERVKRLIDEFAEALPQYPIRLPAMEEQYKKTLEKLAFRLADKAARSGRSVKLEPMNPYERKVIHTALQQRKGVTTRSEGEEPYRRVIIEPVK